MNTHHGRIYFDAHCPACVLAQRSVGAVLGSRGIECVPMQTPGTAERLGVNGAELAVRMHVLTSDGRVLPNADGLAYLCRKIWWLWPLGVGLSLPGFRGVARVGYDWIARNRYVLCGLSCRSTQPSADRFRVRDWLIALILPLSTILMTRHWPPWAFMWATAFGLGAGLKWLTWADARMGGARPSLFRRLGWFLAWPGLDGRAFLNDRVPSLQPRVLDWVLGIVQVFLGTALVVKGFPMLYATQPRLALWVGMIGFACAWHFGLLRLSAMAWLTWGVNAQPIMSSPLRSTSLAEFWGRRWNLAFSIPARRILFLPLARRMGNGAALFSVFVFSGLLHELVISLPAGAGYGRPTAYFLIQAVGVAVERTWAARVNGLPGMISGWLYTAVVLIAPIELLFPACFLNSVMTPFLQTLTTLFLGGIL